MSNLEKTIYIKILQNIKDIQKYIEDINKKQKDIDNCNIIQFFKMKKIEKEKIDLLSQKDEFLKRLIDSILLLEESLKYKNRIKDMSNIKDITISSKEYNIQINTLNDIIMKIDRFLIATSQTNDINRNTLSIYFLLLDKLLLDIEENINNVLIPIERKGR